MGLLTKPKIEALAETAQESFDFWRTKNAPADRLDALAFSFFGIAPVVQALVARLDELEARLAADGPRTLIDAYKGVHKPGEHYERGSLVTSSGGLWFCMQSTETKPGTGPHWQLCVKSGAR